MLFGQENHASQQSVCALPLRDLDHPRAQARLEELCSTIMSLTTGEVGGLVVAGDGFSPTLQDLPRTTGLALELLAAVRSQLPASTVLTHLWALCLGSAQLVIVAPDAANDGDLLVSPPILMRPVEDTVAAAEAVLQGRPWPRQRRRARTALLERLAAERLRIPSGRTLHATAVRTGLDEPHPRAGCDGSTLTARAASAGDPLSIPPSRGHIAIAQSWAEAREALVRLHRFTVCAGTDRGSFVTECERLDPFVEALRADPTGSGLIAHLLDADAPDEACPCAWLEAMRTTATLRPDRDIRPGGEGYELLVDLRMILVEAWMRHPGGPLHRIWRALGFALAVLAWADHRNASAAGIAEELLVVDPDDALALCLATSIEEPAPPAWTA